MKTKGVIFTKKDYTFLPVIIDPIKHILLPKKNFLRADPPLAIQEVRAETVRDEVKEQQKHQEKLNQLTNKSQTTLYGLSSVFPFDLFPDEICIEPNQVDVCIRTFFFTEKQSSIAIKNISDVSVQTSIFFATIHIIDISYIENSVTVSFLKVSEAQKARNIIQGLIVASKEGVDITQIPINELSEKVEAIGKLQTH